MWNWLRRWIDFDRNLYGKDSRVGSALWPAGAELPPFRPHVQLAPSVAAWMMRSAVTGEATQREHDAILQIPQ